MKKLIFLITVFALLFTFNKAEAQTKLKTGVPMVMYSVEALDTTVTPTGNNIFFSGVDVTYGVQIVTDTVGYTGTHDGNIIRQYSNDGVNFVSIDSLTLSTEANDITTFTGTSWTHYYMRFIYVVETADTTDLDITIYAVPNK